MELGDIAFARSGLIVCDVFGDLLVEFRDLTLKQCEARSGLTLQHGDGLHLAAIAQARALFDQTRTGNLQVSEIM